MVSLESQNYLLFRNKTKEERCKLEDVLRPKTTELRRALNQQRRKLNGLPEADYDFIDSLISDEEDEEMTETASL